MIVSPRSAAAWFSSSRTTLTWISAGWYRCRVTRRAGDQPRGLGFTGPILDDLLRAATGRRRRFLPVVGRPGERAFVTREGAWEGWHSLVGPGSAFDNRVPAGSALSILGYHAAARLPEVRCPLLVCVSDEENLVDPAGVPRHAARAPHAEIRHYPADHFAVYHGELRERIVADQVAFLVSHLVGAVTG